MRRLLVLVLTLASLGVAPEAGAHRLSWQAVRAVALDEVEIAAAAQPEAVASGIASRCWRRGNHRVTCPVYMRIDHVDELGFVRHLRCDGSVEAVADGWNVDWIVSPLPCIEMGPPPVPTPEQLQALAGRN